MALISACERHDNDSVGREHCASCCAFSNRRRTSIGERFQSPRGQRASVTDTALRCHRQRHETLQFDLRSSDLDPNDSYLVDPASSHMLVSKIKPCKCKYELSYSETANGSLNQLWFI